MRESIDSRIEEVVKMGYFPSVWVQRDARSVGCLVYMPELYFFSTDDLLEIAKTEEGLDFDNKENVKHYNTYIQALDASIDLCHKLHKQGLTFKNSTLRQCNE